MRGDAGEGVVRVEVDENGESEERRPAEAAQLSGYVLGEDFGDAGIVEALREAQQSAVPDEDRPAAFLAGNVVPREDAGEQEHEASEQRRHGDVQAVVTGAHPEVADHEKHDGENPLGLFHRSHFVEFAVRRTYLPPGVFWMVWRIELQGDPRHHDQAQQAGDDRGADPTERREFIAGLHRHVACQEVARLGLVIHEADVMQTA